MQSWLYSEKCWEIEIEKDDILIIYIIYWRMDERGYRNGRGWVYMKLIFFWGLQGKLAIIICQNILICLEIMKKKAELPPLTVEHIHNWSFLLPYVNDPDGNIFKKYKEGAKTTAPFKVF